MEAERRAKEAKEVDMVGGFCLEPTSGQAQQQVRPSIVSTAAVKVTGDTSGLNFSKKPPMFYNKKKAGAGLAKSDFPELGSVSEMQDKGDSGTKASGPTGADEDMGATHPFMSSVARPSDRRPEERSFGGSGGGSKPMFTSSKKKNFGGGADLTEIANSRQNYDMSFLSSAAKSGVPLEGLPEGQEGKPREPRQERPREREGYNNFGSFQRGGGKPAFDEGEDDFEMVRAKKRPYAEGSGVPEMSFGKPTFSRGG